jgi:hypothetical protein
MDKIVDKGLQKQSKVIDILKLAKIGPDDIIGLSNEEMDCFRTYINEQVNKVDSEKLDELMEKIELITCQKTKNEFWERNHMLILQEITNFITKYGRMPLKSELEIATGISRQTLTKHFKEYKKSCLYNDYLEQFQFMSQKLLAKLFQFSIEGNIKAARLYLEMTGIIGGFRNQNNFIQINSMIVSQDKLGSLPKEQLAQIEEYLKDQLSHYKTCVTGC